MRCVMAEHVVHDGQAELTEEDFAPAPSQRGREIDSNGRSPFHGIKYLLKENRLAMACVITILLIVLAAILAPLSPYDPDALDIQNALQGPGAGHLLGTTSGEIRLRGRCMEGGCHWRSDVRPWPYLSSSVRCSAR